MHLWQADSEVFAYLRTSSSTLGHDRYELFTSTSEMVFKFIELHSVG